jgi:hypothetical protein
MIIIVDFEIIGFGFSHPEGVRDWSSSQASADGPK